MPPRGLYTKTKLDYDYVASSTELLTHFVAKSIPHWTCLPESATSGLKVTAATFKTRLSSPPASSIVGVQCCPLSLGGLKLMACDIRTWSIGLYHPDPDPTERYGGIRKNFGKCLCGGVRG